MKINLEKLVELEKKYNDNNLTYEVIQKMVEIVLDRTGDSTCVGKATDANYLLAFSTLEELGIIEK